MGYMKDVNGRRLDSFSAVRDIPGVLVHFDPDDLSGSNGANVLNWTSRYGGVNLNITPSVKPTLLTNAVNGHKLVRFITSSYLRNITSINESAPSGGHPQPLTFAFIFRATVASPLVSNTMVFGGGSAQTLLAAQGQTPYINAGTATQVQGPDLADGLPHVIVVVMSTGGWRIYVDGYLTGSTLGSQPQGAGAMSSLFVGSGLGTALPAGASFDYGDLIVATRSWTPPQVSDVTNLLAKKYGISILGSQNNGVDFIDVNDAGGQPCRLWLPPGTDSMKLAIWSHPYTNTEQMSHGYTAYPWVHALLQEGWGVIATRQHGDSWGNDDAVNDILAARTLANTYREVTDTMLLGASMGGLPSATAVARNTLPDLRGVALSDAAFDLTWAYTANSNAYQSGINSAYGISSIGGIPSGNDPMQQSASLFTAMKWRFYASSADTSVSKTSNTDAFRTKIAAAAVKGLVTHNTTNHLNAGAFPPADLVAFAKSL